jgi:succinyl-CoA synthetase beta subunit
MDDMLRTIVLLITHLSMLGGGAGLALVTVRSRRQELLGKAAILDTRETALQAMADQLRLPGQPLASAAFVERAPASRRPRRSPLLTASLDEAVALNITAIAEHEQYKRVFVDIMTNIAQAKRWHQGTARVA